MNVLLNIITEKNLAFALNLTCRKNMKKENFLVWYDPQIKEVISVEKKHVTKYLLEQLNKENVEVCEIYEENLKKANEMFLQNIEKLKPNLNIMPASSDCVNFSEADDNFENSSTKLDEILDSFEAKNKLKKHSLN